MGKIHRTAQGKPIDMEALSSQNKDSVALGNMGVNAAGDELGDGGEVVKTSNERVQDYYSENPNTSRKTVSVKGEDAVDVDLEEKPLGKSKSKSKAKVKDKSLGVKDTDEYTGNSGKKKAVEKTLPDGSIEIVDPEKDEGNNL
jgi:hypothetical protein